MRTTFEILKEQYGAVMTLEQLATTLSRKPEGLRMALLKPTSEWARCLNAHKVYIGRRVYFPIEAVAHILDAGSEICDDRLK
ncbi:hypothetical protein D0U02_17650 [Burkholderia pseudomallei]|uniref:DNA-binding protein n=2 Tax=Burkholderia pseudomallei TaxID=28450 RepID=Q63PV6_BURPS|nr:hypothetical protein [Burkholderia pseudomallei]MBD2921909.1 hypothetical protein [Burkholderia pseudomallei]MBD3001823.1 hypothetical protein [Burkholderia pseudomallei]RFS50447.1 hypothetical protein D0U05_26880 [Burkholderia pseudomallei]RFS60768.1 hypothetical protein D0U02_17650 [Burkholderia pseudomallei]RFS62648.1 hypothetical protein D0U01_21060 [Burkholderia pseudomallei]